jgi:hypothetical protein
VLRVLVEGVRVVPTAVRVLPAPPQPRSRPRPARTRGGARDFERRSLGAGRRAGGFAPSRTSRCPCSSPWQCTRRRSRGRTGSRRRLWTALRCSRSRPRPRAPSRQSRRSGSASSGRGAASAMARRAGGAIPRDGQRACTWGSALADWPRSCRVCTLPGLYVAGFVRCRVCTLPGFAGAGRAAGRHRGELRGLLEELELLNRPPRRQAAPSTSGGTRRVRLVRGEGRDLSG